MQQTGISHPHSGSCGLVDNETAVGTRFPVATGGPTLSFDLLREAEQLRCERAWSNGRNAKTLVKHSDYRLVLTVMKAGTEMHQHQAKGTVSIQPVSGHVRVHVLGEAFDLVAAQMLSLDANLPHDVEAIEDSALVVGIAWPDDSRVVQAQKAQCGREESDWSQDESVWN